MQAVASERELPAAARPELGPAAASELVRARRAHLRRVVTVLALFAVALALRVSLIEDIHFAGDEARFWATARDIAEGRAFPALGPPNSSGGNLPGSLFYVVMAIPQLFSHAPEASAGLVALLGALSAVLLYDGLRRPFGEAGGLTAGFVYAVAPWTTLTNCTVWTPYTAMSVLTIALWAALRVRENPRSRLVAVAIVASACIPQFHLTGIVTWIGLFVIAGHALLRLNWRWVGIGLFATVVLYAPGIYSELDTGFANVRAVLEAKDRYRGGILGGYELAPRYALRFLSTDVSYFILRGYYGGMDEAAALELLEEGAPALPYHPLRFAALIGSGVFGLLAIVWPAARGAAPVGRSDRTARALFVSAATALLSTMALLAWTEQQIFAHYVLVLVPSLVALTAVLGQSLARTRAGAGLLTAWLLAFGIASLDVERAVATFDHRAGLAVQRAVVERVLADSGDEPPSARIMVSYRGPSDLTLGLIAEHAYERRLRLGAGASKLYRLQERHELPPGSIVEPPTDLDTVVLYRLR